MMRKIIWNFHRASGLLLIILVFSKLVTGFSMTGHLEILESGISHSLHTSPFLDVPLVLLFTFHALYGILKGVLAKVDKSKQKALFIIFNAVGVVIVVFSLLFIYVI
ncbi:hypothetical protein JXI42_07240 [bacterium]|nr:hypothetical protein [bacterium]